MSISYHDIQAFLYREGRLLDDREWDEWLTLYRKDAEFWMPAWDDDDQLTRDPQSEISLIYYPSREGLEDRVYRIKTERSGATSIPEPRTTHQVSNLEVLSSEEYSAARREFNDEDWQGATDIVSRYYNLVLADCGAGLFQPAARSVLRNNIATVTGPTPPGTGVKKPATCDTES